MATTETRADPTFLQLIRELRDDVTRLLRQEVALVKSEAKSKALVYLKNAALIGIAGLIGLYALFFVLFAINNLIAAGLLAAGLSAPTAAWIAPLLLGLLLGGGASLWALRALKAIRAETPIPTETLESLQEDKAWLTEKVKG